MVSSDRSINPGIVLIAAFLAATTTAAEDYKSTVLRVYEAPEADQGVAVDDRYFYAVDNHVIAKYDRETGERIAHWDGGKDGPVQHLNSCLALAGQLECSNSNYPATPMASSVEYFSPDDLSHLTSHSLGLMDEGSLTFTDRIDGGRIAGFAHYSGNNGEPYKDSRYGAIVLYDDNWRRMGGYALPPTVSERMKPHAASGGAIGPNGLLYALGHDLPEMYVLGRPLMGPYLTHLATISLKAEGQAFSFEPGGQDIVWVIDRRAGRVRRIQLPVLNDLATDERMKFR